MINKLKNINYGELAYSFFIWVVIAMFGLLLNLIGLVILDVPSYIDGLRMFVGLMFIAASFWVWNRSWK